MSFEEGYTKFWIYTPSSSGFITGGALVFFGGGRTGPADTWDASCGRNFAARTLEILRTRSHCYVPTRAATTNALQRQSLTFTVQ